MTTLPTDINVANIECKVTQAGQIVGVSSETIRRLARDGVLPSFPGPAGRVFRLGDLLTYRSVNLGRYGSVRRPAGRPRNKKPTDAVTPA